MLITKELIDASRADSSWSLGNDVLYKLCRDHPGHTEKKEVIAKIWLIGKSYSAAIERRKKEDENEDNDAFYEKVAAGLMRRSIVENCNESIDSILAALDKHTTIDVDSLRDAISAHGKITALFNDLSKKEKRSLASKYLHFHRPALFYIFDSRAVGALRSLSSISGRAPKSRN